MPKFLTVAREEYYKAVRSKAFLVGVLLMPLLMSGGFIVMGLAEAVDRTDDKRFAVIDRSGDLYAAIEESARARNEREIWDDEDPGKQVRSRYLPERVEDADGEELALADRVRAGELLGYVVIPEDVLPRDGAVPAAGAPPARIAWFTETPTDDAVPNWLEQVLSAELRTRRARAAGLEPALVASLLARTSVREMGLPSLGAGGEVIEAEESDKVANQLIPVILTALLYMLIMTSAPALMNNVLEEKMQKIAEVLVSSVSPFQLLLGKLLSTVLTSATLSALYLGAGLAFAHNVERVPPAVLDALSPAVLGSFFVFLVMGLLIFGSLFSAIGAACNEIQDAQSMMAPAIVLAVLPMFFLGVVVEDPGGTVARVLSFVPPATPVLMLLRSAVPPGVPLWELLLACLTTSAFALGCVYVGSKIFRVGLLSHGSTPSYRQLVKWVMAK